MKIFSASQMRAWDQYTIKEEPVTSAGLMERAASRCADWILAAKLPSYPIHIFCGKGNNGGDGLAIARLLADHHREVAVYVTDRPENCSADFRENYQKLQESRSARIQMMVEGHHPVMLNKDMIIIDALFGTGLQRPPQGLYADVIKTINDSGATVISIDTPSGLFADSPSLHPEIVKANFTLTFQTTKLAFMAADTAPFTGQVVVLDIGLNQKFADEEEGLCEYVDDALIRSIYRRRDPNAHKGSFGHALLIAGSYGKMGAAVLAARACLRTGAGLLTCHIPQSGYNILQIAVPEAMVVTDFNSSFVTMTEGNLDKYKTIGIGPGLGTASETATMLRDVIEKYRQPIVLDADALNILSRDKPLLAQVPPGSVLTPHPREFQRLFGDSKSDLDRFAVAMEKARELNCVIVLKGPHTLVAGPEGRGYFNSTGNAGLAKGGTGDTLTGMITSLLSQSYPPLEAAVFGVYLHGLAADHCAKLYGQESMLASELANCIGLAFADVAG